MAHQLHSSPRMQFAGSQSRAIPAPGVLFYYSWEAFLHELEHIVPGRVQNSTTLIYSSHSAEFIEHLSESQFVRWIESYGKSSPTLYHFGLQVRDHIFNALPRGKKYCANRKPACQWDGFSLESFLQEYIQTHNPSTSSLKGYSPGKLQHVILLNG